MIDPLFVYGNWSAYDEISDNIELTEELAMRQMAELVRLKKLGVRFDAYLMDAFWYAKDGAYRTWRKPHWPDGPDRWLEACRENGLLPGLWFTANTLFHMDLPAAWADSIDSKRWGMCLYEGGFLDDFMEVLDTWYQLGIRIFKLDFAEFKAVPAGKKDLDARPKNIRAYRNALKQFRAEHPEAVFMAFNGFEDRECMDNTDHKPGSYIDPAWLDVFDSLYSGDPRPSDVPCPSFWRSVDIYSDYSTRLFHSSGIPLDRIDNCGFMAGPTGTCYWRGKAAWRGMLLLSLARGGRIHVAYGDLSQFDEQDAKFWATAQDLYDGTTTRFFGGWPGEGRSYGWIATKGERDIATVVGAAGFGDLIDLPVSDFGSWRVAAFDMEYEAKLLSTQFSINGSQLVLFVAGEELPSLTLDKDLNIVGKAMGSIGAEGVGELKIQARPDHCSAHLELVFVQQDEFGQVLRNYPGENDWPPFHVSLELNGTVHELPPMFERKVWSGLSWWIVEFSLGDFQEPPTLTVRAVAEKAHLSATLHRIMPTERSSANRYH
ncbi:MAG TPA: hypothetical protein VG944_00670 [Fimbriimonas sp.]|nr:hypothetical protein [Fimbriimonas sp.]